MAHKIDQRMNRARRGIVADERGNVAVIFALAMLPMLGFAGAAVDYSRASSARSEIQAALSSASLILAKEVATTPESSLTARGDALFKAIYKGKDATNVAVTVSYAKPSGSTPAHVVVSGSSHIDTAFMSILGIKTMDIATSSTAAWGNTRLRVALALDNTTSMTSSSKMTALKEAAKILVKRLQDTALTAEDVYISVVPFTTAVNLSKDKTFQTNIEPYINWNDWDEVIGTCSKSYYTKSKCLSKSGVWTTNHTGWDGTVTDRDEDYDVKGDAPTLANNSSKFTADPLGAGDLTDVAPVTMLPLTNDFDLINKKIDAMVSNGLTNQPVGLFWAWWTLRSNPPFNTAAPAKDTNYKYITAVILLTDGDNTRSRANNNSNNSVNKAPIDARQKKLCNAIKADNSTQLYTIDVNTDKGTTQQVVKDCASKPSNFFALTAASQISGAFAEIAASLSKLRISK